MATDGFPSCLLGVILFFNLLFEPIIAPEHCFAFGVGSRVGYCGKYPRPTGRLGASRDCTEFEHFVVIRHFRDRSSCFLTQHIANVDLSDMEIEPELHIRFKDF